MWVGGLVNGLGNLWVTVNLKYKKTLLMSILDTFHTADIE